MDYFNYRNYIHFSPLPYPSNLDAATIIHLTCHFISIFISPLPLQPGSAQSVDITNLTLSHHLRLGLSVSLLSSACLTATGFSIFSWSLRKHIGCPSKWAVNVVSQATTSQIIFLLLAVLLQLLSMLIKIPFFWLWLIFLSQFSL